MVVNGRTSRSRGTRHDLSTGRPNSAKLPAGILNFALVSLFTCGITGCMCTPSPRAVAVHKVLIDFALAPRETSDQLTQDALRPFVLSGLRKSGHIRTVTKQWSDSRTARVRVHRMPAQSLKQKSAEKTSFGDIKVSVFLPPKGSTDSVDKQKEQTHSESSSQECCWGHTIIPAQQFDANAGKSIRKAVVVALRQVVKKQRDQPMSTHAFIDRLQRYQQGETLPQQQLQQALQVLRKRKEKQASPLICRLLQKETNAQLARLLLQTLGHLGDLASIKAIIAYGHRTYSPKSPVGLLHAVAAAGHLGGVEAAGWLFALSTGHSHSSIRNAAAEALIKAESLLGSARKPVAKTD